MDRSRLAIPVVVALLWVATPAQARSDKGNCPRGAGCIWDQMGFRGRMAKVPSGGCIDSTIRSAVNSSDEVVELYSGAGCYGLRAATLQPGDEAPQVSAGSAGSATGQCSDNPAGSCSGEVPSALTD